MKIRVQIITDDGNDHSEFFDSVEDAIDWMQDIEDDEAVE